MKINLNFLIKDLSGKEIPEAMAGKILANILVAQTKGEALKYYDWALKLYKGEILEVDRSDFDKIKKFVSETETLPILTKAQILENLKDDNT